MNGSWKGLLVIDARLVQAGVQYVLCLVAALGYCLRATDSALVDALWADPPFPWSSSKSYLSKVIRSVPQPSQPVV